MFSIKFKIDRFRRFRTEARQVFNTQKPFPSKIPLTMKTVTPNSLLTHFLIKFPFVKFFLKSIHPLHQRDHSFAPAKNKYLNFIWVLLFFGFIFFIEMK